MSGYQWAPQSQLLELGQIENMKARWDSKAVRERFQVSPGKRSLAEKVYTQFDTNQTQFASLFSAICTVLVQEIRTFPRPSLEKCGPFVVSSSRYSIEAGFERWRRRSKQTSRFAIPATALKKN
jgi:hypothetical protein